MPLTFLLPKERESFDKVHPIEEWLQLKKSEKFPTTCVDFLVSIKLRLCDCKIIHFNDSINLYVFKH